MTWEDLSTTQEGKSLRQKFAYAVVSSAGLEGEHLEEIYDSLQIYTSESWLRIQFCGRVLREADWRGTWDDLAYHAEMEAINVGSWIKEVVGRTGGRPVTGKLCSFLTA